MISVCVSGVSVLVVCVHVCVCWWGKCLSSVCVNWW